VIGAFLAKEVKERVDLWNRFWFTPAEPHTLCLLRVLSGSLMFYTHLVWSFDLTEIIGPNPWTPSSVAHGVYEKWGRDFSYTWSHFDWLPSTPAVIWAVHIIALIAFALFAVGYHTRLMAVLSCFFTISYSHRLSLMQYGLDQVNGMMALYLMLGPCGELYSVDAWMRSRKGATDRPREFISANIAIRMIQVHLCIVYLFSGIQKMKGAPWWDGSALWDAIASFQYQSADLTWMVHFPIVIAFLTHLTVFWEAFYPAIVWPRATRWFALGCAVMIHGGIGIAMGMPTFGAAMIFANMSFLSPRLIDRSMKSIGRLLHRLFGWEWAADAAERRVSKAELVEARA
jgi:uncharacterized membrane protein YphA (DoxX/SURF4 family)